MCGNGRSMHQKDVGLSLLARVCGNKAVHQGEWLKTHAAVREQVQGGLRQLTVLLSWLVCPPTWPIGLRISGHRLVPLAPVPYFVSVLVAGLEP